MIFYQKIDSNNFLYKNKIVSSLSNGDKATWFYDSIGAGSLYVEAMEGAAVESYLPYSLSIKWLNSRAKMKAHKKSLNTCRIKNINLCDFIPEELIIEHYSY